MSLTPIEWTDYTHNIAWGCEKISPGCAHCYADTLSHRRGHNVWGKDASRRTLSANYWRQPILWNRKAAVEGVRRRVFCSSMCDVFEDHPTIDVEREKLWPLIRATPMLDWQLLTKRPERILDNLPADWGEGYPNVWLGTSVENQRFAVRAATLLGVPARVRFLSCEPLLGPIDLTRVELVPDMKDRKRGYVRSGIRLNVLTGTYVESGVCRLGERIDWVIIGGESGPHFREMREQWAVSLVDQCGHYGVARFLKQLGGHPSKRGKELAVLDGKRYVEMPQLQPDNAGEANG